MARSQTLQLNFEPAMKSASASAQIFVASASSYLKECGAVVISGECKSQEDLRDEIARLKRELSLLEKAGEKLFTSSGSVGGARAEQMSDEARDPVIRQVKTPLQIGRSLVVADRMTQPVITIHRNQMLDEAEALLRKGRFRHLVVLDDETEELVGVLSRRQITMNALDWVMGHGVAAYQKMIAATPVKDVMETTIITIAKSAPLSEAAARLSEHEIGCLPVMESNQLVGILTEGDFVSMLRDATVGSTP